MAAVLSGCTSPGGDGLIPLSELPDRLCSGALTADEARALLPPNRDVRYLVGPNATEPKPDLRRCEIFGKGKDLHPGLELWVFDDSRTPDFPLAAIRGFDVGDAEQAIAGNLSPLGPGLQGFATNFGAEVYVPPCRAGDWWRRVTLSAKAEDAQHRPVVLRPDNRQRFADTVVAAANRLRVSAGCTEPPLPAPAAFTDPVWTPVLPETPVCGLPGSSWGTVLPADQPGAGRGLQQAVSGSAGSDRNCRIAVASEKDRLFSMWIIHGYDDRDLNGLNRDARNPQPGIHTKTDSVGDKLAWISTQCGGEKILVTVFARESLHLPDDFALRPPLGRDNQAVCAMAAGR